MNSSVSLIKENTLKQPLLQLCCSVIHYFPRKYSPAIKNASFNESIINKMFFNFLLCKKSGHFCLLLFLTQGLEIKFRQQQKNYMDLVQAKPWNNVITYFPILCLIFHCNYRRLIVNWGTKKNTVLFSLVVLKNFTAFLANSHKTPIESADHFSLLLFSPPPFHSFFFFLLYLTLPYTALPYLPCQFLPL